MKLLNLRATLISTTVHIILFVVFFFVGLAVSFVCLIKLFTIVLLTLYV